MLQTARYQGGLAMNYPKHGFLMMSVALLLLAPSFATPSKAAGRSFEECQAYAISLGIHPNRSSSNVNTRYARYNAAGTAKHPQGVIARCMSGRS
jgi:hypothetical protein